MMKNTIVWHSMEEEHPPSNDLYLVYMYDRFSEWVVSTLFWFAPSKKWKPYSENDHELQSTEVVTHWAELPNAPGKNDIKVEEQVEHLNEDELSVAIFAFQMKKKLEKAKEKGRDGWYESEVSTKYLADLLLNHLGKDNEGNLVDIANFCMMLHMKGARPDIISQRLEGNDSKGNKEPITDLGHLIVEVDGERRGEFCEYRVMPRSVTIVEPCEKGIPQFKQFCVKDGHHIRLYYPNGDLLMDSKND